MRVPNQRGWHLRLAAARTLSPLWWKPSSLRVACRRSKGLGLWTKPPNHPPSQCPASQAISQVNHGNACFKPGDYGPFRIRKKWLKWLHWATTYFIFVQKRRDWKGAEGTGLRRGPSTSCKMYRYKAFAYQSWFICVCLSAVCSGFFLLVNIINIYIDPSLSERLGLSKNDGQTWTIYKKVDIWAGMPYGMPIMISGCL